MSMRFAALFAVIAIFALLSVYYITFAEMEEQIDGELQLEMIELSAYYRHEGLHELAELTEKRNQYGRHLRHYYALTDQQNNVISGNRILASIKPKNIDIKNEIFFFDTTQTFDDDDESILRIAYSSLPRGLTLTVAQANNSLHELREHTFTALLVAVFITLCIALINGVYMGRVVLSRLTLLNSGLDNAIKTDFRKTLVVPEQNDEFQTLTLKLNIMLGQIGKLIQGMRQVTDNVAHDLRSPLTRIRNGLEVTLLQSRSESEYRKAMESAIHDSNDLINTFNALLNIAQAEANVKREDWQSLDLAKLLLDLADLYEAVAEEKHLGFEFSVPKKQIIDGNNQLLSQAISNLLENAIKYTPEHGTVKLELLENNGHPTVVVSDNGPGIPENQFDRVLERFYRLDGARNSPGNGLGLSLVNAVVNLHGAKLVLKNNRPGLRVEINF